MGRIREYSYAQRCSAIPDKLCCRHLVNISAGTHLLSDVILSSAILQGEDGVPGGLGGEASGAGSSGAGAFEFGVDPSLDPELAMVSTLVS